ncbi:hypothetical protein ACFQ3N_01415 [Virgibacillus byunsanensis]|uniref:Tetratricopeptide repeat protein n=1 Tax=Virgibacillus byunsanensis TaxID=570945 RepID=A0ABW3LFB5_9BACI
MSDKQFVLYDHQKPIQLQAERVSLYMQSEIIEAVSENHDMYYLFFYKSHYLTAVKAKKVRRQSYVEFAFKKGMVYNAPHPFIHVLLSSNNPCKIVSYKPLLKKLDSNYTPQEKAFILTFFESFIPKKHLFNEIKSIFYVYRRNGQSFLGYQILRILMDFAPNHSLVKQLPKDSIFDKYAILYNDKSEEIFTKDSIYAEKILYNQKEDDHCFQQLVARLEKESRWIDLIALYSYKLTATPSNEYYHSLLTLLEQYAKENDMVNILEVINSQIPTFPPLKQDLFNKYVETHNTEKVVHMLNNQDLQLTESQVQTIGDMLDDTKAYSIHPEMLPTLLSPVMDEFPDKAQKFLHKYVILLMRTQELKHIKAILNPFKGNHKTHQLYRKIDTMHKLTDDLDQMQRLGELYYEFRQMESAIECFSWEMELKPNDPKPLQWLSKTYREMGMKHESDAYQQLCVNLQKRA